MLDRILSFDTLWWVLMLLYIPACIGLIAIVLLQKGKGVGFAGAFGAGGGPGSDTVFGPRLSQSLPVRLTYVAASLFMLIAVVMSLIAGKVGRGEAPELAQETTETSTTQSTGGLSAWGIGTNEVDADRLDEAPEPGTEAPPAEEDSTELTEGPGMQPAVPSAAPDADDEATEESLVDISDETPEAGESPGDAESESAGAEDTDTQSPVNSQ